MAVMHWQMRERILQKSLQQLRKDTMKSLDQIEEKIINNPNLSEEKKIKMLMENEKQREVVKGWFQEVIKELEEEKLERNVEKNDKYQRR